MAGGIVSGDDSDDTDDRQSSASLEDLGCSSGAAVRPAFRELGADDIAAAAAATPTAISAPGSYAASSRAMAGLSPLYVSCLQQLQLEQQEGGRRREEGGPSAVHGLWAPGGRPALLPGEHLQRASMDSTAAVASVGNDAIDAELKRTLSDQARTEIRAWIDGADEEEVWGKNWKGETSPKILAWRKKFLADLVDSPGKRERLGQRLAMIVEKDAKGKDMEPREGERDWRTPAKSTPSKTATATPLEVAREVQADEQARTNREAMLQRLAKMEEVAGQAKEEDQQQQQRRASLSDADNRKQAGTPHKGTTGSRAGAAGASPRPRSFEPPPRFAWTAYGQRTPQKLAAIDGGGRLSRPSSASKQRDSRTLQQPPPRQLQLAHQEVQEGTSLLRRKSLSMASAVKRSLQAVLHWPTAAKSCSSLASSKMHHSHQAEDWEERDDSGCGGERRSGLWRRFSKDKGTRRRKSTETLQSGSAGAEPAVRRMSRDSSVASDGWGMAFLPSRRGASVDLPRRSSMESWHGGNGLAAPSRQSLESLASAFTAKRRGLSLDDGSQRTGDEDPWGGRLERERQRQLRLAAEEEKNVWAKGMRAFVPSTPSQRRSIDYSDMAASLPRVDESPGAPTEPPVAAPAAVANGRSEATKVSKAVVLHDKDLWRREWLEPRKSTTGESSSRRLSRSSTGESEPRKESRSGHRRVYDIEMVQEKLASIEDKLQELFSRKAKYRKLLDRLQEKSETAAGPIMWQALEEKRRMIASS
eukprot:SM000195S05250  [mRNA]  locus=s195:84535:88477:+ [translate_table: standard]